MFVPAPCNRSTTLEQRNGVLRANRELRDRGIDVQRPLRRRLMPEDSIWTQNRRKCANQHATSGSVV